MQLLQEKNDLKKKSKGNVEEINWRRYVLKSTFPPVLPDDYFELPVEFRDEKIFSYLESRSVQVTKLVRHLGEGKYCLDFIWDSDFLKVLNRKNEMKYIRGFIISSKGVFDVTLIHNHPRHSLSKRIGLRLRRLS